MRMLRIYSRLKFMILFRFSSKSDQNSLKKVELGSALTLMETLWLVNGWSLWVHSRLPSTVQQISVSPGLVRVPRVLLVLPRYSTSHSELGVGVPWMSSVKSIPYSTLDHFILNKVYFLLYAISSRDRPLRFSHDRDGLQTINIPLSV